MILKRQTESPSPRPVTAMGGRSETSPPASATLPSKQPLGPTGARENLLTSVAAAEAATLRMRAYRYMNALLLMAYGR